MAIYVEGYRHGLDWRYHLWDTRTGTCASYCRSERGIVEDIRRLLREGGVPESPDVETVITDWISQANDRGTNDPSKKPTEETERTPRTENVQDPTAGPIRRALRARDISEQCVRAIFDIRVAEWSARLSPETRAFLERTFVLPEILSDRGRATYGVGPDSADGAAIAEIAREWADVVLIERTSSPKPDHTAFVFRLR